MLWYRLIFILVRINNFSGFLKQLFNPYIDKVRASAIRECSLQRFAAIAEPSAATSALMSGIEINEYARKKHKFQLFFSGSIYRISHLIMCFFNDGIVRPPPAPACGTKSKWVRMVVGALIS
ncbi:MAG: hypothetical protein EZS28_026062, partial [Streblomastix strix]